MLELRRQMNLWKAKKRSMIKGRGMVDLDRKDFDGKDRQLIRVLGMEYERWTEKRGEA